MEYKWIVSSEFPAGHLVLMTAEEEAQLAADGAAWAAAAAAAAITSGNATTIRDAINARMEKLRQARTALAAGSIFAALSMNEKAVIDGLLEDNLYLARIVPNLYDGTA